MKFLKAISFLILCIPDSPKAQLCNGSLGEPIVNVTFGNVSEVLPKTVTTYDIRRGCPKKGEYTLGNLILGCGENPDAHSWYLLAGDHTRDLNGQFMLVNAESTPGTIHLDTATGLCSSTTYQYTAWLANVMQDFACGGHPVLPNITFTISSLAGILLATATTGDLPIEDSRVWKQYGLSFTTPPDIDAVVLRLSTNPKFGCGSAFVVDDITFSMCGPGVVATIDGSTEPANVCADYTNPFVLNGAYSSGFNDPAIQWQNSLDSGKTWKDMPGETSPSYSIPRRKIGTVLYRMAVAERPNIKSLHCRVLSNPIYTEVHPVPDHHAPQNLLGCNNKNLLLPQADASALKVQWSGPNGYFSTDPKSIVPNIKYSDTGIYTLKQLFYFGCTSIDTFNVNVFPSTTLTAKTLYSICEGSTINFDASGDGTFKWTPSTGLSNDAIPNPVATPHDSIVYKLMVTNSFGCKDSADITVNVFRNPMVNAGPDRTIVLGDTVLLKVTLQGTAINYSWSPTTFMDNPTLVAPRVFPQEGTEYIITAISTVGCGTSTSRVMVKVYKDIYIPNAFTPNGDGINDQFKIFAADGYTFQKFIIYNRWGKLVFSAKDSHDSWNGICDNEPQPAGTYVYYLELKNSVGKKIIKKGTITLIR